MLFIKKYFVVFVQLHQVVVLKNFAKHHLHSIFEIDLILHLFKTRSVKIMNTNFLQKIFTEYTLKVFINIEFLTLKAFKKTLAKSFASF